KDRMAIDGMKGQTGGGDVGIELASSCPIVNPEPQRERLRLGTRGEEHLAGRLDHALDPPKRGKAGLEDGRMRAIALEKIGRLEVKAAKIKRSVRGDHGTKNVV